MGFEGRDRNPFVLYRRDMPKPVVQQPDSSSDPIAPERMRAHLEQFDDAYAERFAPEETAVHIRRLEALRTDLPAQALFRPLEGRALECTVFAFDARGAFSLITGILTGLGLDIQSGDVFTGRPPPARRSGRPGRRASAEEIRRRRRKLVDVFIGTLPEDVDPAEWEASFRDRLQRVFRLVERGGTDDVLTARRLVNEWVTERLARLQEQEHPVLYPVELDIQPLSDRLIRLNVISQDTPAFLYALSSSLALQELSIEAVRIRTLAGRIEDRIDVSSGRGRPLDKPDALDRLRLCVLLTKQFAYFLGRAPDPYAALSRFETLLQDILRDPERGRWTEWLRDPRAMRDLARVLGASDFLWEDFIRLQYEQLLPILQPHLHEEPLSPPAAEMDRLLRDRLAGAASIDEMRAIVNEFKNAESFRLDLDQILDSSTTFRVFSEKLTALAEAIVSAASTAIYNDLRLRHGTPRTVAGLEADYAVCGLGKLGGAALGYASDIELMLLYGDQGRTDGDEPLDNGEFFSRMALALGRFIESKREGIFRVDLRLRPHGNSGPPGVSLESFCRYYGPGGSAHSYERLALVRLRAVAGSEELGRRVERLRDEYVYSANLIDPAELRDLRRKQADAKNRPGVRNAKFSPGALVDLEYSVQILQVGSGGANPALRTPRIHDALEAMRESGMLRDGECAAMNEAYTFLRRLINALRMLRGSAEDLFLPPDGSLEFVHLARRMGYRRAEELEPARRLMVDFETHTAMIRGFVERHLGRDSLPAPTLGNVADLIFSDDPPPDLRENVLRAAGFADPSRAYSNLRRLAGTGTRRDLFAPLAVLACDCLRDEPDPDMALNNWERLLRALPDPEAHFRLLFSQPRRFSVLLGLFAHSQFLADTLIRNPDFFEWATSPSVLYEQRTREVLSRDLTALLAESAGEDWPLILRRFRKREMLRIGTRDLILRRALPDIVRDLSALAEAIVREALERVGRGEDESAESGWPDRLCILAFGKLGGEELNYSSDIDLLAVCDPAGAADEPAVVRRCARIAEGLRRELSRHTAEGVVYRVDLRLRPHGNSGALVPTRQAAAVYYAETAALWEIQALLKLRPIAGALHIGRTLLDELAPLFRVRRAQSEITGVIDRLRRASVRKQKASPTAGDDIKTGPGGIRDIEFLVQGLQLLHAPDHPAVLGGNTLAALGALRDEDILSRDLADALAKDYLFLRRIEHGLQILEDRQMHALPRGAQELDILARRILGASASGADFRRRIDECRARVHDAYADFIDRRGGFGPSPP